MSRAKGIVFTVNNYSEDTYEQIVTYCREHAEYAIIGKEIGESGTPHLQGYAKLHKTTRWASLASAWSAHIETARKGSNINRNYCSKGGDFIEIGDIPDTPEENRFKRNLALARKGDFEKLEEIDPGLFTRYYDTYQKVFYKAMKCPDCHQGELKNYWYTGQTGTGKSTKARTKYPNAYIKGKNKWWDDYQGEQQVIIEEVGKEDVWMGENLKIWADRWPFRAEIKRGSAKINPRIIIVTSNVQIEDIWTTPDIYEPLKRRFKTVVFRKLPNT